MSEEEPSMMQDNILAYVCGWFCMAPHAMLFEDFWNLEKKGTPPPTFEG